MRIITISAAARPFIARNVSSWPCNKTCHARDKTRVERASEACWPRTRSGAENVTSSPAPSTNLSRVNQWVNSAKSAKITAGSAPILYCASNSAKASETRPLIIISNRSNTRPRSASPKRPRIVSAVRAEPSPCAGSTWAKARSSKDSASRAEPSAARAISASASSGTDSFSAAHTLCNSFCVSSAPKRRKSKRWQRDKTVTGTCRISVVAKMNLTCSGGSSKVFSKPLKAAFESICTSSII